MTATSLCGSCGAENPTEAIRCTQCADYLDPALAPVPTTQTRRLEWGPVVAAAGVATVLLLVFHVLGASFSMRVLPAAEHIDGVERRLARSVDASEITEADALAVVRQLAVEAGLRERLRTDRLRESEASAIRARLPAPDQSTVLGLSGVFSLFFTALSLAAGSIAATAWARTARLREVGLGLVFPVVTQAGLWLASVEWDPGAITGGRLWLVGTGPAFEGAPALLLVMGLVASTATALGAGYGLGALLNQLAGRSECPHCEHVFAARKHTTQCPSCLRPLKAPASLPLQAPGGGMTRASAGTDRLLCTLCAKTYAADQCPAHPQEPLLDPRRDDVRFGLLELDTQAGTSRFAEWTAELERGVSTTPTTGGVCTICAVAYPSASCPHHADEPLLDPTRPEVRQRLFELDVGRETPRFAAWTSELNDGLSSTVHRNGPGLCMECATTYEGAACPVHPDEPLLDPTREDVRLELIEADDRQRRAVGVRLMFAAFFVALGLGVGTSTLLFDGELVVYLTSGAIAGMMAVARVLTPPLSPRRFTAWTGDGAANPGDLHAHAKQELAPLVQAGRKAVARAGIIAAATAAGVLVGLGAAVALGISWSSGAILGGLAVFVLALIVAMVVDEAKGVASSVREAGREWNDPYA